MVPASARAAGVPGCAGVKGVLLGLGARVGGMSGKVDFARGWWSGSGRCCGVESAVWRSVVNLEDG